LWDAIYGGHRESLTHFVSVDFDIISNQS
jgi:hypothetical protein